MCDIAIRFLKDEAFLNGVMDWWFGAYDLKAGTVTSLYTITNDTRLNHRVHTIGGVLEEKCEGIDEGFFLKTRWKK